MSKRTSKLNRSNQVNTIPAHKKMNMKQLSAHMDVSMGFVTQLMRELALEGYFVRHERDGIGEHCVAYTRTEKLYEPPTNLLNSTFNFHKAPFPLVAIR